MANGWGGKRPGQGRKKGQVLPATKARLAHKVATEQYLRERIMAEQAELVKAQLELAKGAYKLLAKTDAGLVPVPEDKIDTFLASGDAFYQLEKIKPNQQALTECWNRVIGKPTEHHDVDLAVSGNVTVTHVHED